MELFISYNFADEKFVRKIVYHLRKQPLLEPYCYGSQIPWLQDINNDLTQLEETSDRKEEDILNNIRSKNTVWRSEVGGKLSSCELFIFFVGQRIGNTQKLEALHFQNQHQNSIRQKSLVVKLTGAARIPDYLFSLRGLEPAKTIGPNDIVEEPKDIKECIELDVLYAEKITEIVGRILTSIHSKVKVRKMLGITRNSKIDLWVPPDGIPIRYPFDYEKDIIKAYSNGGGKLLSLDKIECGCPESWPEVENFCQIEKEKFKQILPEINNPIPLEVRGGYRKDSDRIIVDARSCFHCRSDEENICCLESIGLTFPEAGPRENLVYPMENPGSANKSIRVGVLVSGGIAPGINAVIKGIVDRHTLYNKYAEGGDDTKYDLEITGFRDGFSGLLRNSHIKLNRRKVRDFANKGGSLLGTSRFDPLLNLDDPKKRDNAIGKILEKLELDEIDILYVIGGDGSMRAAHMLWTRAQQMHERGERSKLSVVAIPKTMDNDILWAWQSFGFMSAVEKAKQFILQLHTEASSGPRLGVMQLFGSDSGFVVSHAALASGVCDYVLIPETDFSMEVLSEYIKQKLRSRYSGGQEGRSPYGIILMAETAIPRNNINNSGCKYIDDPDVGLEANEKLAIENFIADGRRVQGKTPDELRRGGIKIISRVIEKEIRSISAYWKDFQVITNEPRHLIRAIDPSVQDVIFGQRMGTLAVDNAMAGYTDFMISQWLTEYVLVPLKLVVMGRKRVPQNGIFWKSVLANTGQPHNMV